MQRHTRVYFDFFGYDEASTVICEMCGDVAVDIHHLERRSKFGSKKEKDYIENLVGLCRECHIKAEAEPMFNMFCRIKHLENVCFQVYALIDITKRLTKYEKD